MDQFTYEQLKNELYKRDKMIEYKKNKKTFELPDDVWKEVLSYFRKPIKHLLEPLSYEKLKYYYRLTTTQQLGWFATCIPLEKRREMMYSRFLKYHHKVRQMFMASPSGFDWDTELQTFRCFVAYRPHEIFADKILIPKKGYKMTSKIIEQTDVYIKLAFTNKPSEMDSGMAEAGM